MNQLTFSFVLGFFINRVRAKYGDEVAREVRAAAKPAYRDVLPHVPDVGGFRNPFLIVTIANGWFIATFLAMKSVGYTAADSMSIWADLVDDMFRKMPGWLQKRLGQFLTSDGPIRAFHKQAERSQLREYPGDWVYQINDSDEFDVAYAFEECAAIKMYRDLGVEELGPYCSFGDVTYSSYLGLGLDATETLGLGFKTCTLSYRLGGIVKYNSQLGPILATNVTENPRVQAVVKVP